MAVFKCKMCGADLTLVEGSNICECEYCGTQQTVPTADNDKKMNLFNRANRLRFANEFDKASGVFESIVSEFPEEAEAYWGLCLCKYGIEYVDDPATAKKIPTCHRTSYDSIFNDSNFEMAQEYADVVARKLYREEAKEIDRLQKSILAIAQNEEPFDIFICYKETAENGQRTIDSVLAQDMYDALTEKGYKVFFARITLEDKLGQEYEPYIFSALSSAKVMLAVGTSYEYYNAVWVKNEWGRFLDMMKSDKKKVLIPCYKDIDAYDIPGEFKPLQAQDMGKVGFMQDLIRGIGKIIPLQKQSVQNTVVVQQSPQNATVESLLKRAFMFLEEDEWNSANEYAEKVLDLDPECARAYVVKLLVERKLSTQEELHFSKPANLIFTNGHFINALFTNPIENSENYKKAVRFADEQLKAELKRYSLENSEEYYRIRYDNAKAKMNSAQSYKDYKIAAKMFENLSDYRNSIELAKQCYEKAEESFLPQLLSAQNKAVMGQIGDVVSFGGYEWYIIDKTNENCTLLCKGIVECKRYHEENRDITWHSCTLRRWLNNEFFNEFAAEEKKLIADTTIVNSDNAKYETRGGIKTVDKIFLLSLDEAEKYMMNKKFFAINQMWWLRSPGYQRSSAALVNSNGSLNDLGFYVNYYYGVRPALNLKFESFYQGSDKLTKQYRESANEYLYQKVLAKMAEAVTAIDFTDVANQFDKISHYRDSDKLSKQCRESANEYLYQKALAKMDAAVAEIDFKDAANQFANISHYRDSAQLAENCKRQALLIFQKRVIFGKTGDVVSFGKYEWYIIDKTVEHCTLLCKKIVENLRYHEKNEAITWENCTLRKWLNEDFFNEFEAEEKALIADTNIINSDNAKYGTKGGNNTVDKIFILSLDEITNYLEYNRKMRRWLLRSPSNNQKYAVDADTNSLNDAVFVDFDYFVTLMRKINGILCWLRSPGEKQKYAACANMAVGIHSFEGVNEYGTYVNYDLSVCPALNLKFKSSDTEIREILLVQAKIRTLHSDITNIDNNLSILNTQLQQQQSIYAENEKKLFGKKKVKEAREMISFYTAELEKAEKQKNDKEKELSKLEVKLNAFKSET